MLTRYALIQTAMRSRISQRNEQLNVLLLTVKFDLKVLPRLYAYSLRQWNNDWLAASVRDVVGSLAVDSAKAG